jgi:hypothetical protein
MVTAIGATNCGVDRLVSSTNKKVAATPAGTTRIFSRASAPVAPAAVEARTKAPKRRTAHGTSQVRDGVTKGFEDI